MHFFFLEKLNVRSIKHQFNEAMFTAQLWTFKRRPVHSAALRVSPVAAGKAHNRAWLQMIHPFKPVCHVFKAVACPHLIVWSVPLRRHISSQVFEPRLHVQTYTQRKRCTDHAADFLYNSPALILLRRRHRIALPLWTASVLLLPAVVSICYCLWSGLLNDRCTLTVPKSPLHVFPCIYSCVIKNAFWMCKIVTIFSFAKSRKYKNKYDDLIAFMYKPLFLKRANCKIWPSFSWACLLDLVSMLSGAFLCIVTHIVTIISSWSHG